ncbi:8563_t:CDS:1, partial [Racocetra fulgida]
MKYKTFNLFLIALSLSLLVLTINASARRPTRFNIHANSPTRFNKLDNKLPVKSTNTTQTPACQTRGSPGWNDLGYIPLGYDTMGIGFTPQQCCNSCISNQTCFEWYFNPINSECAFVTSNPCSGATYSISCIGLE